MSTDAMDIGSGNREAAECLRTINRFFTVLEEIAAVYTHERYIPDFGSERDTFQWVKGLFERVEPFQEYMDAFERVKRILVDLATFLWNRDTSEPHVAAPIINPHMTPIIHYEGERLKKLIDEIERQTNIYEGNPSRWRTFKDYFNFDHWIWPKAFKCIDTILNSLAKDVPGLGFVGELKEQVENALLNK